MPKYSKATKAKHAKIVTYWFSRVYEGDMAVDESEAHELCWRCAEKRLLEMSHIIPKSLGGGLGPENLVLLCKQCHKENPNTSDRTAMWAWLKAAKRIPRGQFWLRRAEEEHERMYGRKPLIYSVDDFPYYKASAEFGKVTKTKIRSYFANLKKAFRPKDAIAHFGEGRINTSTIAALLKKADDLFLIKSK